MRNIRNFSIIAHVDHGKSTLADRIIQLCGGLEAREMEAQVLDSNPIERERGITIKAQSVSLPYTAQDGVTYQLNFIDTPGHVDFSYEVSRSLAACEGALLVVDAAQGVEAQSVANCYTAVEQGLEVVPVLNKIDLPTADIDKVKAEIEAVIGIDAEDAVAISAKTGLNVGEVLERLGVSQTTLYALLRRGDLPRVKVGRRTFVPVPDLDAYLEARRARRGDEPAVPRHATTCSYLVFHNRPCDCSASGAGSD